MAADYHRWATLGPLHPEGLDRALGNISTAALAPLLEQPQSSTEAHAYAIVPAAYAVHYAVVISSTVLVALVFLVVYIQLLMVICFGYKLLSYQTILLFDILLWAALRLALYSFYYYNCCDLVKQLEGNILGWILMSLPAALQYCSLAILVHYFGESIFKVLSRRQENASLAPPYRKMRKYRVLMEFLFVVALLTFVAGNIVFYFVIGDRSVSKNVMSTIAILRVVMLDGLFLVMAVILGVCIIIIYATNAGKDVLDAQRGRKCWPFLISVSLILLFASRGIYSVVAVSTGTTHHIHYGYSWTFATDEGDNQFGDSNKYGYIAYFSILIVWEVMPTYIIVFFFRVRLPRYSYRNTLNACKVLRKKKTPSNNEKNFFENPNRYDETDQLLQSTLHSRPTDMEPSNMSIPSLTGSITNITSQPHPYYTSHSAGYGSGSSTSLSTTGVRNYPARHSINTTSNYHRSKTIPAVMPGTTPPKLFTSPSFFDR